MDYIVGIEIFDHLEKVMDRFEDVANRISGRRVSSQRSRPDFGS